MSFLAPLHVSVSQIRTAACCPRIFYFDFHQRRSPGQPIRVTRIWERSHSESTAGGTIFHATIERFNRLVVGQSKIKELIDSKADREQLYRGLMQFLIQSCLNSEVLYSRSAEIIQNFSGCVDRYIGELADVVQFAMSQGMSADQIAGSLFADLPKRVDLTFHFSEHVSPVHVTGKLDYVYHDWRVQRPRIVDYKLAPSANPNKDQFQVAIYALMYAQQHGFECDTSVHYLFPDRDIFDLTWAQVEQERSKIYQLIASLPQWARFEPNSDQGLHPPGDTTYCSACRWRRVCEQSLGPKSLGDRCQEEIAVKATSKEPQAFEEDVQQEIAAMQDLDAMATADQVPEADLSELESLPTAIETEDPNQKTEPSSSALTFITCEKELVSIRTYHLSTHIAVVGAAGSGKSWLAKTIAEEAILNQVPVLAIDPQGDLVQFLKPWDKEKIPPEWSKRYRQFHELCEPRVFTPGSSHGIRLSLNPIQLAKKEEIKAPSVQLQEEEYLSMIEAVAVNLVGLVLAGKRSVDQQQAFVKMILQQLIEETKVTSIDLTQIARAMANPESCGVTEDDAAIFIRKSEREQLARQVNALAYGPVGKLFSGGLALDLDRMRQPVQPGKVPLNIIYLNALTDNEKHAFLAALATEIYRWMCCRGGDPLDPQLLFYLDEARDYLPAGASKPPAKMPITRLFTQGRKYGVGCLVCTQSPRSVDYNVFGNCSTKLIGRLETPQDSDQVGKWFTVTGTKPEWLKERTGASAGTFIGRWPEQEETTVSKILRSRPIFSNHGGAWTPEIVESLVANCPIHLTLRG